MGVFKVEIRIVDDEWQWLGKLDSIALKKLCEYADKLSDEVAEVLATPESEE